MHVIVHGGAGSPPESPATRQETLTDAAERATAAEGPMDAVLAALRPLESDPAFNAGVGGAVQSDGEVRTDAGLMTDAGQVGAACAMSGVVHATDVATVWEPRRHTSCWPVTRPSISRQAWVSKPVATSRLRRHDSDTRPLTLLMADPQIILNGP